MKKIKLKKQLNQLKSNQLRCQLMLAKHPELAI